MVVKEPKFVAGEVVTTDAGVWDLSDSESVRENTKWAHVEGASGYYFPEGIKLSGDKTSGNVGYIELWTDHGVNPQGDTYAYAVLPAMTAEETKAYAENPTFEVLRNDEKIQAVYENSLGITGIVFWQTPTFNGISVSNPCILMLREGEDNKLEVSVSDPTQKLSSLSITLPYVLTLESGDSQITAEADAKATTTLRVDVDGSRGKTYSATFTKAQ
jgi:hyaluronate lyase